MLFPGARPREFPRELEWQSHLELIRRNRQIMKQSILLVEERACFEIGCRGRIL